MAAATSRVASSFLFLLLVVRGRARGPCDPLAPEYCQLPQPNSFFTRGDAASPTGVHLNYSADTWPRDTLGRRLSLAEWNTMDGFSPFPSIMAYFPGLSDSGLPPHWDMQQSMGDSCPTILMELATGKKLPHFAELDTALGLKNKTLMLWPSVRLETSSHYVVAFRGLVDSRGQLVKPSPAFQALRDNISTSDPDIEYRRKLFEDIFARLESAGVTRSSLQLAWDFTTASQQCLTERLLFMRDDASKRTSPDGPSYTIYLTDDNYSNHIFRRLQGIMSVPSYLTSPQPGSHLVLDDRGIPVYQGTVPVTFTVLVPRSVANGSVFPAIAVQYGHGLFGDQSEVESGYLQEQADRHGYVLFACNWWGMDNHDVPFIVEMVSLNLSNFRIIPDRLHQGVVNAFSLMKLIKGSLSKDPLMEFGGRQVVDTGHLHYYGNSLGGIMGDVYMAVTTDVTRGVLGVPGGPFSLILPRSKDFESFAVLVRVLYPDPVDYVSGIGLIGQLWSRLEPAGYMSYITRDPLPNTPTHRVLYQYGLGDAQVNLLGLYAIARSAGALMFQSNPSSQFLLPNGEILTENLYGFPIVPDDTIVTQDVVAVGFDCGAPPEPSGNSPPNSTTDTHNGPRRSPLAQEQIDLFLRSGEIRNVCGGMCKCTP